MIRSQGDIARAIETGQVREYFWRKAPTQTNTSLLWFDFALSPGNPPPKYWFDATPLTAKAIYQSTDGGFYHGPNVSPQNKYLQRFMIQSPNSGPSPMNIIVMDYLLYYPSCDDGTTDEQVMTNSVSLPRYTTGEGVMILPVSIAGRTGGQTLTVKYTNSQGVSGRVSQAFTQNSSTAIGQVLGSATATVNSTNPFVPLQDGDTGVRLIESVTMNGTDVGLFSLILVKPLFNTSYVDVNVPHEKDLILHNPIMPQIYDDAFLSFVGTPNGSVASTSFNGYLRVFWG
jgi:hypothetical protein